MDVGGFGSGMLRPISLLTLSLLTLLDSKLLGKFPMDMRIPSLNNNIMLESNPMKSTMLVGRLAVLISRGGLPRAVGNSPEL